MHALREWQRAFCAAVFDEGDATLRLRRHCAGDAARVSAGIAAYRGNVSATLAAAVVASYPVLGRIVGDAFLAAAARRFAATVPSKCGDLNRYGGEFDRFLEADASVRQLPYLPDVARLEWRVQQLLVMAESPPQELERMCDTQAEHWPALRLRLDPAHAVFDSRWPLARIWQLNQDDSGCEHAVDMEVAECVLAHRRAEGVAVTAIARGEFAFLCAVLDGATLERAVDRALSADREFVPHAVLAGWIASRLLLSVH